jgi:hypothetical protein
MEEMSILTPDEQETLSRLCRKIGKQEQCGDDQQMLIGELKEQQVG